MAFTSAHVHVGIEVQPGVRHRVECDPVERQEGNLEPVPTGLVAMRGSELSVAGPVCDLRAERGGPRA